MKKTQLRKSKLNISKIGLGTVQFGLDYSFSKSKSQAEVYEILERAQSYGINLLDTAREYGDSETKIGNYLERNENDFIVATKLAKLQTSNPKESLYDQVNRSIEKSLKELKLGQLDILQLHQTDQELITNPDLWDIIRDLTNNKLFKAFGVSVYELEETVALSEEYGSYIDFFQVPYSIFDGRFDVLSEKLADKDIDLISRSAFLKGIIPCAVENVPVELEGILPYKVKLKKTADKMGLSEYELALLYVYYQDSLASSLIGVSSVQELEDNIRAIDKHSDIMEEEIKKINIEIRDTFLLDPRRWTSF